MHEHTFYRFGDTLHCICGASKADTRTQAEREASMERATLTAKIRVNETFGVDSPNMKARLAELTR